MFFQKKPIATGYVNQFVHTPHLIALGIAPAAPAGLAAKGHIPAK
jgi:hypothetical protein